MFRTHVGAASEDDDASLVYLRPETAQGIFINFANVLTTSRRKLPFGVAQIGKSFRNEVTPGNFIFRTREFEQMEMEYFVKPGEDEKAHQEWIDACYNWFTSLGISGDNLRLYEQPKEELAHYAKRTVDIQYRFFPEREEEYHILKENLPFSDEEILVYVTDFLQMAHSNEERYTVRDGVNMARYALKLQKLDSVASPPRRLETREALHTAVMDTLGAEALRYVPKLRS